eukprot:scaffold63957_cov33-Prasinocladus_malaysianus.AAC.1
MSTSAPCKGRRCCSKELSVATACLSVLVYIKYERDGKAPENMHAFKDRQRCLTESGSEPLHRILKT